MNTITNGLSGLFINVEPSNTPTPARAPALYQAPRTVLPLALQNQTPRAPNMRGRFDDTGRRILTTAHVGH